jgi:RNA polymerase sigma-70 factor, ECF subfamily
MVDLQEEPLAVFPEGDRAGGWGSLAPDLFEQDGARPSPSDGRLARAPFRRTRREVEARRAMATAQPSRARQQRSRTTDAAVNGARVGRTLPRPLVRRDGERIEPSKERVSELVAAAQGNDREAFGELYRLYYRPMYTLARFYLPQQAEDIVAETFVRAWGAVDRYRDMGRPFVAWLYAIERHIVSDELRARRRVEPRDELPDEVHQWDHDDRLMLAMGLERLPSTQRRVVELRYLVGLTHQEIATLMRKTVGAVKAIRWRALRNLAAVLGER